MSNTSGKNKLLIATRNRGKMREYRELLEGASAGLELLYLDDLGIETEVEETGTTFEENATIKARAYAALSGLPTIADDSGLEVDALGGGPGIYSARSFGGGTSRHHEAKRRRALLGKIEGVPDSERTARFRCVVAVAEPGGDVVQTAEGLLEGTIARYEAGDNGFGYDPIFFIPDRNATLAQLSTDEKNMISHRARALRAARPIIARMFGYELLDFGA